MFGSDTDRLSVSLQRPLARGRLLRPAVALAALGVFASWVGRAELGADEVDYTPVVTLKGVKTLAAPGKKPGKKSARRSSPPIEFLLDIDENVPVGAKLQFDLVYRFQELAHFFYEFKGGRRTGVKFVWTPEMRLPIDSYPYILRSSMPLNAQSPGVSKAIEAKRKVYPPHSDPWPWNHKKEEFVLGTEEERKAEEEEVAKIFEDWANGLLRLNNDFVATCEEVEAKKKFVKKDGKLDGDALRSFVVDWMKRMAVVQGEIMGFPEKEPGLWAKNSNATYEAQNLSLMVAKRCYQYKLKETLAKLSVKGTDFRVQTVPGFYHQTRSLCSPLAMKATYDKLSRLAKFAEEEETPETSEGGEGESGGADGPAKKDDAKDAPKKDAPKKTGKSSGDSARAGD